MEEPYPLLKEKILVQQRPYRADVNHVRTEFVVQRHPREDIDLLRRPAPHDDQFIGPRHFAGEAHTSRTHDAAIGIQQHVRTHIFFRLFDLLLGKAGLPPAELIGVILQMTLPRLIAHRAIHGVVDKQVFHDRLLVEDRLGRVGVDHLAIARGGLAGGEQLGDRFQLVVVAGVGSPDLGKADSTVGDDRKPVVVAVMGDLDPIIQGDLKDHLALLEFDFPAVDGNGGHEGNARKAREG